MALSHVPSTNSMTALKTCKMDPNDNSSDKWSDAESDDEFISSKLKEDTGKIPR